MKLYRIYDTETGKYWTTPKGKTGWERSTHARNAWNVQYAQHYKDPKFTEQTRYECHEFELSEYGNVLTRNGEEWLRANSNYGLFKTQWYKVQS